MHSLTSILLPSCLFCQECPSSSFPSFRQTPIFLAVVRHGAHYLKTFLNSQAFPLCAFFFFWHLVPSLVMLAALSSSVSGSDCSLDYGILGAGIVPLHLFPQHPPECLPHSVYSINICQWITGSERKTPGRAFVNMPRITNPPRSNPMVRKV